MINLILFALKRYSRLLYNLFRAILKQDEIGYHWDEFCRRKKINFTKTIIVNYRSLSSWKDFMQFPILIFGKCEIRSLVGSIEFPNGISFGQVKIGLNDFRSKGPFKIFNQGTIIFRGNSVIYSGSELDVFPNAVLDLGDDVHITENVLIFCTNRISIHEHSSVTYNCNILDSDFHHVVDLSKRIIYGYSKPIEIGAYNWIGNNTTIKKGVKTPNYTIVAAAYSSLIPQHYNLTLFISS